MPSSTWTLIQSTTVGVGGAASVTISSIPAIYGDLILICSNLNSASGTRTLQLIANADTTSSYLNGFASANGTTSTGSESVTVGFLSVMSGIHTAANNTCTVQIMDYLSDKRKQVLIRGGHATGATPLVLHGNGNLPMTAAITQLQLKLDAGNLAANSTFSLYGVATV